MTSGQFLGLSSLAHPSVGPGIGCEELFFHQVAAAGLHPTVLFPSPWGPWALGGGGRVRQEPGVVVLG